MCVTVCPSPQPHRLFNGKKIVNPTAFSSKEQTEPRHRTEGNILPHFTVEQVKTFRPMLSFLNAKDRDILLLIFVARKKQKDVQQILQRRQSSLAYDIKRIRHRLRFIFFLHSSFDIFMEFIRNNNGEFTSQEIEILTLMFYTSSFTQTAVIMKLSQVKVRYSFDKCLRKMEVLKMWEAYEIFQAIRENLNIVRRVYEDDGLAEQHIEALPY